MTEDSGIEPYAERKAEHRARVSRDRRAAAIYAADKLATTRSLQGPEDVAPEEARALPENPANDVRDPPRPPLSGRAAARAQRPQIALRAMARARDVLGLDSGTVRGVAARVVSVRADELLEHSRRAL